MGRTFRALIALAVFLTASMLALSLYGLLDTLNRLGPLDCTFPILDVHDCG